MKICRKLASPAAALLAAAVLSTPALALSGTGTTSALQSTQTAVLTAADQAVSQEDWQLLLVNAWHKLPEDYHVELKTLANGLQVDARIYDDLNAMLTDCREAGLEPIVCSAYRTEDTQTRLYRNKVSRLLSAGWSRDTVEQEAARWVAPPGTSEHQTGLALDIVSADYQLLDEQQAQTPEQQWLMAHCWEYGFVLRYPTDKCAATGIGYEPWHYRYVGKEAAREMQQKGLCLEEYLAPDTQSNFQKEDGQEAQQGADAGQNGSSAPKTQSKPVVPEAPDMAVV
jgi:D-alanyl-D-alanine carboxypeptidase|nr:M15 family metallopeptidase [uncultured Oscillibacter sp.]